MPCDVIRGKDFTAIICKRGQRQASCRVPQCGRPAPKLCDWPIGHNKTCDMPLCVGHAHGVGPDRDYCPAHFALSRKAVEIQPA